MLGCSENAWQVQLEADLRLFRSMAESLVRTKDRGSDDDRMESLQEQPEALSGHKVRCSDQAPASGLHQGQRFYVPRKQAGQMTATCFDQSLSRKPLQNRNHPQMTMPSKLFKPINRTVRLCGNRCTRRQRREKSVRSLSKSNRKPV